MSQVDPGVADAREQLLETVEWARAGSDCPCARWHLGLIL